MTLFLFGIQVGTGALLLLYYRPSASEAYESVQFIMTRVPFGWLIRFDSCLVGQPDGGAPRSRTFRASCSSIPIAGRGSSRG